MEMLGVFYTLSTLLKNISLIYFDKPYAFSVAHRVISVYFPYTQKTTPPYHFYKHYLGFWAILIHNKGIDHTSRLIQWIILFLRI